MNEANNNPYEPKETWHVIISGRVQGVFFRVTTQETAQRLGVTGRIKNRYDGNVEALFQGNETQLKRMIDYCHEGPEHARVDQVEVNKHSVSEVYEQFRIVG